MLELSQKNNVPIDKIKINGINDDEKFPPKLLAEIYSHNAGEIFLLSDNIVQDGYDAFPQTLKAYVQFIESEVNCKVSIISVGPERHQTIIR